MDISKELAIKILKYLDRHPDFYFPFSVVNKEYSEEDNDYVEIEPSEWRLIAEDERYQTFQLWENLQNLDYDTVYLLSKGYIEKITGESLHSHVKIIARNYSKESEWDSWGSKDSELYGMSEFMKGKAEAYNDCVRMIKNYQSMK